MRISDWSSDVCSSDLNATALRYYDQVLDIYQGDPNLLLALYNSRGNALKQMARGADALVQFQQALTLAEKMGSRPQQWRVLRNMARTATELGDHYAAAWATEPRQALAGSYRAPNAPEPLPGSTPHL